MHHKKFDIEISLPIHQNQTLIKSQSNFPPISSSIHNNQPHNFQKIAHQFQIHNEPIKPFPSTPHRRPIMTPDFTNYHHHHHIAVSKSPSSSPCFTVKVVALKLFRHIKCTHLLKIQFQIVLLVFLLFLFFFTFQRPQFFLVELVFFSTLFLIRLLLSKLNSSNSVSKPAQPVYWSIGSKPKSEKKPNSGSWVQIYSNGDVYEGEFHKGKCSGSGVYYYYMSGRYEGDWIDEKYDGYGVETWARGSRYRGQYRQGLRHGLGVYRFFTGDVYSGEWSNGQSHGVGVHTCEDGSRYSGEFKWGIKHGIGQYHFRNGDMYAGEYFADKMHGFGLYRFSNGHCYEGAWHEGKRQGPGMYTFRNGETQYGYWQNGILNVRATHNIHRGSPFAVNDSKVLTAVQEARRAADKAYQLAKVDDRINKAIAAANKAANAARVAAVKAAQNRLHPSNNIGNAQTRVV